MMKQRIKISSTLWLLAGLFFMSCADDFFDEHKEAFYKLYGNGTLQEAVGMQLVPDGSIYIIGNQYVRNQDSAAVVLIRANAAGNQLWSRRYYGKGYSLASALLTLPGQEQLLLCSSRLQDGQYYSPQILKINQEGELLRQYPLEQAPTAAPQNRIAQDMVLGEEGTVFVLGNVYENAVPVRAFIQKVDLSSGLVLDQREFKNSEITEGKKIFRYGQQYYVLGNTLHTLGETRNQSLFLAAYSSNLVEAGNFIVGGANKDSFEKAFISSRGELVVLSTEQDANTKAFRGRIWFANPQTLAVRSSTYLDYSANEVPQAMVEDGNSDLYIAINAMGERGNTNILLQKTDYAAAPLWPKAITIGGAGDDRVREVKIANGYVYLLSTLDMQNENTLISLSKIKF